MDTLAKKEKKMPYQTMRGPLIPKCTNESILFQDADFGKTDPNKCGILLQPQLLET